MEFEILPQQQRSHHARFAREPLINLRIMAHCAYKAFAFGQYLGNRYKNFPNIIWMHGNDFQSWQNANDDALVQAVARGIRSVDLNHIHTVELTAQVLTEYNRFNFKPVLWRRHGNAAAAVGRFRPRLPVRGRRRSPHRRAQGLAARHRLLAMAKCVSVPTPSRSRP